LNWWIGTIFAMGSLLFAVGSLLSLVPGWAEACQLTSKQVNAIFFVGSIPFTAVALLFGLHEFTHQVLVKNTRHQGLAGDPVLQCHGLELLKIPGGYPDIDAFILPHCVLGVLAMFADLTLEARHRLPLT
jgi:hypothetical protein